MLGSSKGLAFADQATPPDTRARSRDLMATRLGVCQCVRAEPADNGPVRSAALSVGLSRLRNCVRVRRWDAEPRSRLCDLVFDVGFERRIVGDQQHPKFRRALTQLLRPA